MNNQNDKTLTVLSAQVKSLTQSVALLLTAAGLMPNTEAAVTEAPAVSFMAAPFVADTSDPNVVRVHITEGYMRNRMTLPREIYIKSKRDSYDHSDGSVDSPQSFVVVDGVKYPQTGNQGRSSKIQPSTFGAKGEGQVVVFTKVKGNVWESAIKGKAQAGTAAPAKAKGKSVGSFQIGNTNKQAPAKGGTGRAVANPFAPKAKTQPKVQAPKATGWPQTLKATVKAVKENAAEEFYNDKVLNLDEQDYRVYLKTPQHKAFKTAAKENGMTLRQAVDALRDACEA